MLAYNKMCLKKKTSPSDSWDWTLFLLLQRRDQSTALPVLCQLKN